MRLSEERDSFAEGPIMTTASRRRAAVRPVWDEPARRDDQTMVQRTVRRLIELSLAAPEGGYLGSESELIQALQVSRPTLRQAAKVAENDRLLSVRRGVSGGFYAARPDARSVIKGPALWLHLQSATLSQMNRASTLIFPETAAEAARCKDEALIEELRVFRKQIDERELASETQRETVLAEVYLSRLLARMTGDPVLLLFTDISYSFGLLERDFQFYRASVERREVWLQTQRGYCDAVLAGDADVARLMAQRRGKLIQAWIDEDSGLLHPSAAAEGEERHDGR